MSFLDAVQWCSATSAAHSWKSASISYVAFEPMQATPVLRYLNERHITGIATKRNNPARMPRPVAVLDRDRSSIEADRVSELLQHISNSCGAERQTANRNAK